MTIKEAEKNIDEFHILSNPNEDEQFLYIESLKFLIEKTNESKYMLELGGYYYELQDFDLALKYYEMAALKNDVNAYECLGYIWYYGRTGTKDYKKAFENFEKAMNLGNLVATYKVADMYKNGFYVKKNYEKYKKIIEDLFEKMWDDDDYYDIFAPLPEVWTRVAKIKIEENKKEQAKRLLEEAKLTLAKRIHYNSFFGNFTIMKWLIKDLYTVKNFDKNNFNFYDLYYALSKPAKITFNHINKTYLVESVMEENQIAVRFEDKWFRTIDDFMQKAEIDGEKLSYIYDELENFKINS